MVDIIKPPVQPTKKFCTRFGTPIGYVVPNKIGQPVPQGTFANIECLEGKCTLWCESAKECHEVLAMKAQVRAAEALEHLENLKRMPDAAS